MDDYGIENPAKEALVLLAEHNPQLVSALIDGLEDFKAVDYSGAVCLEEILGIDIALVLFTEACLAEKQNETRDKPLSDEEIMTEIWKRG